MPKAPSHGGEELLRDWSGLRSSAKKIIGQAKLSYDELLTALTEVEMILNSRPLTSMSKDDFEELRTPSHLLIGRQVLRLPDPVPPSDSDEEVTASQLTESVDEHVV